MAGLNARSIKSCDPAILPSCNSSILPLHVLVRPEGVEPPAYRFEACRSIQLSYGRATVRVYQKAS